MRKRGIILTFNLIKDKTMKKRIKYLAASAVIAMVGVVPALAQMNSMEQTLNKMQTTIKGWAQPIVNLVLIALGIFAVGRAVATYVSSRRSQQGGGNEELLSMIATTLIVIGFIFLVNVVFFRS